LGGKYNYYVAEGKYSKEIGGLQLNCEIGYGLEKRVGRKM